MPEEVEATDLATIDDVKDVMNDLIDEVEMPEGIDDDGKAIEKEPVEDKVEPVEDKAKEEDGDHEFDEEDLLDELSGVEEEAPVEDKEAEAADAELLKDAPEAMKNAFIEMRTKIKELNGRIEQGDDSDTVKALRTQVTQLQGQLGAIDVSKNPEFNRKFTVPLQRELNVIGQTVKEFGANPKEVIARAMSFRSKIERKNYLQEAVPSFATELSLMFTKVDSLMSDRRDALKNHTKTSQDLAASKARRREESVGQVFDEQLGEIRKSKNVLYMDSPKEGAEEWNASVKTRTDKARSMIEDMETDHSLVVQAALKAVATDELLVMYANERKKRRGLEKELGIRKGSSPKLGANQRKKIANDDSKDPIDAMDVADIIASKDYGSGSLTGR